MGDIQDPRLLCSKFGLFVILGSLSFGIALYLFPSYQLALLLAIAIWAFCRAYYFAFYVIEHYMDATFRFAGLGSLLRYAIRNRKVGKQCPVADLPDGRRPDGR
jgi:hypothetical protein